MKITAITLVSIIILVELLFNGAMAGIYYLLTTHHFDKVVSIFVFNWWMLFGIPGIVTCVLMSDNVEKTPI